MLILNFEDVLKSISMLQAIAGMRQGFAALGRGEVVMPSRTIVDVDKYNGEMLVMPSFVAAETDALAVKVVGVFPNNVDKGIPSVLGAVCVLDAETCKPLALLDGAAITGVRTAAVSAVATDYLSKSDSRVLAIIGTGVQARTHVEAVCTVRRIERIQIYGRNPVKTRSLVSDVRDLANAPSEIVAFDSGDEAVAGADIVCATTSSTEPVFQDSAIADGTHINAIGSHSRHAREVPGETIARARIVVDQRGPALNSGDLWQPLQSGLITEASVFAELGEIAAGTTKSPPNNGSEITVFKSVGLAMEDAVAARICLDNAVAQGIGQQVEW